MVKQVRLTDRSYGFVATSPRDEQNIIKLQALPSVNPDLFGRNEDHGHVTASALVVDATRDHVLLTHHAKLDMWLPPGGHCDSDPDLVRVCRREVFEETGYSELDLLGETIFDIDIHSIPASGLSREHLHYDVRFAFQADMTRPLLISAESKDLRWVPICDVSNYTTMPSVLILTEKLRAL